MELTKKTLNSGGKAIDGYELEGNFIPADAIPNYLIWEFRGNENNRSNELNGFNDSGVDIELISVLAGLTSDSSVRIEYMKVSYKPLESNNAYPPNNVFFHSFDNPFLPYSFSKGLVIPKDCNILVRLTDSVAFCRLVALPCLPRLVGQFVASK